MHCPYHVMMMMIMFGVDISGDDDESHHYYHCYHCHHTIINFHHHCRHDHDLLHRYRHPYRCLGIFRRAVLT